MAAQPLLPCGITGDVGPVIIEQVAAHWPVVSPNGTVATIDVRIAFQTDDGALLYAYYSGRIDRTQKPVVVLPRRSSTLAMSGTRWLSRIQVFRKGTFDEGLSKIDYEFFELSLKARRICRLFDILRPISGLGDAGDKQSRAFRSRLLA